MSLTRRGLFKSSAGALASCVMSRLAVTTAAAIPALIATSSEAALYDPNPSRPGSRLDELMPFIDPVLHLKNPHTGEEVRTRFFDGAGYVQESVRQLNWIWRDWREAEGPQIDPRLFWGVAAIRTSAMRDGHDGEVTLLSGFRTKKTTALLRSRGVGAAVNSWHMRASAVDVRLSGIPATVVSGFAEWLQIGGTGYYPKSDFTHTDSGEVRRWRG